MNRPSDESLMERRAAERSDRPATLADLDYAFEKHEERETSNNAMLLANFSEAFPKDEDGNPDFSGHRSYHQAMIKAAHAQEDFWRSAKMELMKRGLAGLVWVLRVTIVLAVIGLASSFAGALPTWVHTIFFHGGKPTP